MPNLISNDYRNFVAIQHLQQTGIDGHYVFAEGAALNPKYADHTGSVTAR
jgi:hypothetical protein